MACTRELTVSRAPSTYPLLSRLFFAARSSRSGFTDHLYRASSPPEYSALCQLPLAGTTGRETPPNHISQAQFDHTTARSVLEQAQARDQFWHFVEEAELSGDPKAYSKDPVWRANITAATARMFHSLPENEPRKLKALAELVRSVHPGRAQNSMSPSHLEAVVLAAYTQGKMDADHVDYIMNIARLGIPVEEFRDLSQPPVHTLNGNASDPDDIEVILDFYFAQAARGRVLMLPPELISDLDQLGELVLSPSFVVYAPGKKPRPICNMSAKGQGPNQRMVDELDPNPDGYATLASIAKMVISAFIAVVSNPSNFQLLEIDLIILAMLIMDIDGAFYRVPVSSSAVGMQAMRVADLTILPLCCTFGWGRSAETFSYLTAAIKAIFQANLDLVSLLSKEADAEMAGMKTDTKIEKAVKKKAGKAKVSKTVDVPRTAKCTPTKCSPAGPSLMALTQGHQEYQPDARWIAGHVDDFSLLCLVNEPAKAIAAASDLAFTLKALLGPDALSIKKFKESSFWSQFQRMIGGWFDLSTFSVIIPKDKIQAVLDLLQSDTFSPSQSRFPIQACASLRGKLIWASICTPLGDSAALIRIEKMRNHGESGTRQVPPLAMPGESAELTLAKFHNDLLVRRLFFEAALTNPDLVSCPMLSLLSVEDRLQIPGQSKWLVWISGDFSKKGQSFGIEYWDPDRGTIKEWAYMPHPPETIALLEEIESVQQPNQSITSWAALVPLTFRAFPCLIVAFHDSVKLAQPWFWPLESTSRHCAGEVTFASTLVPDRFWDRRKVKMTVPHRGSSNG